MRVEEHFSAGGIVYRKTNDGLQVLLCGRDKPPIWSLPKGTPDGTEKPHETALREVREETGLDVALEDDLGEIEYWFGKPGVRVHKRVKFYLMSPTGGDTNAHDPEFDRVQWFPADEAVRTLSYPTEVTILERALERVKSK